MTRKSIETAIKYLDQYTMTGYPIDLHMARRKLSDALNESKIDRSQKLIDDLNNIRDVQKQSTENLQDKYQLGLFNGLEMASAIFERREPKFKGI